MPTLCVMLCNAKISKIFEYSKWAADKLSPTSQQPLQGNGSYPNTEKAMTERQMKIRK